MKKNDIPLCKNCKWCKPDDHWLVWWIPIFGWVFFIMEFPNRWRGATCTRKFEMDLVSGKKVFKNNECRTIRKEQYDDWCGPDGSNFEGKQNKKIKDYFRSQKKSAD